jgi:hypothetical protein
MVSSDALHAVEFVMFNSLIQQLTSIIGLRRSVAKRCSLTTGGAGANFPFAAHRPFRHLSWGMCFPFVHSQFTPSTSNVTSPHVGQ